MYPAVVVTFAIRYPHPSLNVTFNVVPAHAIESTVTPEDSLFATAEIESPVGIIRFNSSEYNSSSSPRRDHTHAPLVGSRVGLGRRGTYLLMCPMYRNQDAPVQGARQEGFYDAVCQKRWDCYLSEGPGRVYCPFDAQRRGGASARQRGPAKYRGPRESFVFKVSGFKQLGHEAHANHGLACMCVKLDTGQNDTLLAPPCHLLSTFVDSVSTPVD